MVRGKDYGEKTGPSFLLLGTVPKLKWEKPLCLQLPKNILETTL